MSDQQLIRFIELVKHPDVDVSARDPKDGMNALLKLSRNYGHDNLIQLVELLIERGIDVTATNTDGWNVLHNLCRYYGHGKLFDLILLLKKTNINMEARTKEGYNAFILMNFENRDNNFSASKMLLLNFVTERD